MSIHHLNAAQQQSVLHGKTPLLVLAGAGTGKTSVITHRMAHFVHACGVPPAAILAVTFTNKAAREMRTRVIQLLPHVPQHHLHVSTFHRLCVGLLRRYGSYIGLEAHFAIYDTQDQLEIIRRCLADLNIDTKQFTPHMIRHCMDQWKNKALVPDAVHVEKHHSLERHALDVYRMYQRRCKEGNGVDFGDLLLDVVTLLNKEPQIRLALQKTWSHMLVDEYQDTNPVQYQLLKYLVTPEHSITVVGDDDQSIYGFRGADINNILRFEKDFPHATIIRLEQNYRSTNNILRAANAVVARNQGRIGKTLFSQKPDGAILQFIINDTERAEADNMAQQITKWLAEDKISLRDIAILYRMNAQSRPLEDALRRYNIPYVIYGGLRFYDRKAIKDALAYLRFLVNPRSSLDFLRILGSIPRGIGRVSIDKLMGIAAEEGISVYQAAMLGMQQLKGRAKDALAALLQQLQVWQDAMQQGLHPARLLERCLHESGYVALIKQEASDVAADNMQNITELIAALDEYVDLHQDTPNILAHFLEEIALVADMDSQSDTNQQVMLMTLHSAKGLEFSHVFMPGFEDGVLPSRRSFEHPEQLEEERRLCYVGITRAKNKLCLSATRARHVFGRIERSEVSRFLYDIPAALIDTQPLYAHDAPTLGYDDKVYTSTHHPYPVGSWVLHATFGEGQVLHSEGSGARQKLLVRFRDTREKVIVASFVQKSFGV